MTRHASPLGTISYYAQEISHGRPVWGLLQANQRLPRSCPFRRAIARAATPALAKVAPELEPLVARIREGAVLSEFSPEEQRMLRSVREQSSRRVRLATPASSWSALREARCNVRPTATAPRALRSAGGKGRGASKGVWQALRRSSERS